jgi:zinc/manganese transport system substrate-binding protein
LVSVVPAGAGVARVGAAGALLALLAALAGCAAPRPPSGKGFHVVTTFFPITLFTRAVAADCATVTALVPPEQGPHDVQARPADLAALRQARVLVKNGLGMEAFLPRLLEAAGNSRLRVIDSSRGIATLAANGQASHTGHDHDHHHHARGHGARNPHIWLDPLRAAEQVATIRDGLIEADPGCAATYRRNAATTMARLQALNHEIASQLKPYRGKTFVAFHDVAPYFAERYGLRAVFVVDVPEISPSPADLQRVIKEVRSSQLKALLSEPQQGQRSFNALARDLGVKISVFDPLETGTVQDSQDPQTYWRIMRRNVAELIGVFKG